MVQVDILLLPPLHTMGHIECDCEFRIRLVLSLHLGRTNEFKIERGSQRSEDGYTFTRNSSYAIAHCPEREWLSYPRIRYLHTENLIFATRILTAIKTYVDNSVPIFSPLLLTIKFQPN